MRMITAAFVLCVTAQPLMAQQPSALAPAALDALLAQGREMLAQNLLLQASTLSSQLLAQQPHNVAVLRFAIDADTARAGAMAGLATYERWLKANPTEEPRALALVARAVLREALANDHDPEARAISLEALAREGDADALAALEQNGQPRGRLEARLLASTGQEQAVKAFIAELDHPASRYGAIVALGTSHSRLAVKPLVGLLNDRAVDIRAAAAQALGNLGAAEAIGPLKALLQDAAFPAHYAAAAALYRLNDPSGLAFLRELEKHSEPGIRLIAAQATKSTPNAAWLLLVGNLTSDRDPEIRRQAAELIGPHDPDLARAVLEPLLHDDNPVEAEAATQSLIVSTSDLPTLRRFFHTTTGQTRARVAVRVLDLMR
jgi:HEAT repeat protein